VQVDGRAWADCRAWHGHPARDLIDHRLEADATTDVAQRRPRT
jgi:hypothetical protein